MSTSITFVRRPVSMPAMFWWFIAGACVLIFWGLWSLLRELPPGVLEKLGPTLVDQMVAAGWTQWLKVAVATSGLVLLYWVLWWYQRKGRLILDDEGLHHHSGIPLLRHGLDWSVPLQRLSDGGFKVIMVKPPFNPNPLPFIELRFGMLGLWRLTPYAWVLQQDLRAARHSALPESPSGKWKLSRWCTVDDKGLQRRFAELPLISTLREHGVVLPKVSLIKRGGFGPDLLARSRLRIAIVVLFVLAACGVAGHAWVPYERIYPSLAGHVWLTPLVLLAALGLVWLAGEAPKPELTRIDSWQLRVAQVLVAFLMAAVSVWTTFAVGLVWTKLTQPVHVLEFVLDAEKLTLLPASSTLMVFPSMHAIPLPFRRTEIDQMPSEVRTKIAVRRSPLGLWWQYDVSSLVESLPGLRTHAQPNSVGAAHE